MDEGLTIYKNMWEAYDLDHSIDISQAFCVGLFLGDISSRKEKGVDLLGTLCRDVLVDRARVDASILYTNL